MGTVAVDPTTKKEIILLEDEKAENPPKFLIKRPTSSQAADIYDSMETKKDGSPTAKWAVKAARIGLAGWTNLKRADKSVVEFNSKSIDNQDNLDQLSFSSVMEIGCEILNMLELTEDQAGN